MKPLDLTYGNPAFMQPYWADAEGSFKLRPGDDMSYLATNSTPKLIESIRSLHLLIKNANPQGAEIVVGNGATQMLFAALYALDQKSAYFASPYWFRYPRILELSGYRRITSLEGRPAVEILTFPSNPRNDFYFDSNPHYRIHDMAYNWPQYTDPMCLATSDTDVQIFSLAKATGHAGSRIGWALVSNKRIADRMRDYIEDTTGGPGVESQLRTQLLLNSQSSMLGGYKRGEETCFDYGKIILEGRWHWLNSIRAKDFQIVNQSGMFAWCRFGNDDAARDLEKRINVMGSPGVLSGGTKDLVRLNIGCSSLDFNRLVGRLRRLK